MRKVLALALFIGFLAGCVSGSEMGMKHSPGSPVLDRIVKRGELVVGTSGHQPPFNATNKEGQVIGKVAFAGPYFISLMAPLTYEPLGIALPPHDLLLINWVNNYLETLEGSGELEALREKWFEDISWLEQLKE